VALRIEHAQALRHVVGRVDQPAVLPFQAEIKGDGKRERDGGKRREQRCAALPMGPQEKLNAVMLARRWWLPNIGASDCNMVNKSHHFAAAALSRVAPSARLIRR
jgi:hypothetical protein